MSNTNHSSISFYIFHNIIIIKIQIIFLSLAISVYI